MKKIMFNDRYGLTSAVLRGCKTMTRRIIPEIIPDSAVITNVYDLADDSVTYFAHDEEAPLRGDGSAEWTKLVPKYKVGEVVAVAQAYRDIPRYNPETYEDVMLNDGTICEASHPYLHLQQSGGWDNKMFVRAELMPHQIRITNIRVERLQDISDEDCLREGIEEFVLRKGDGTRRIKYSFKNATDNYLSPRDAFAALIDKVSGKGTWDSNPYVFVYEFELIK